MGIFSFFRSRSEDRSAKVAKDRLQVLIAHERTGRNGPDYLPKLKQDILDVIKKYVSVGEDQVVVQLDTQENCDVLELNITLPEEKKSKSGSSKQAKNAKSSPDAEKKSTKAEKKSESQSKVT